MKVLALGAKQLSMRKFYLLRASLLEIPKILTQTEEA